MNGILRGARGLVGALLRALGLEVTRVRPNTESDPFAAMRERVRTIQPVIFDVGAHVGDTVAAFRGLFPTATIFCFEPNARPAERLAYRFRGDARTRVFPLALGDRAGRATLNINRFDQTSSLLPADARAHSVFGHKVYEPRGQIEVATDTVDGFCRTHGIGHIDILKLDVQGSEYAVLGGAEGMLAERAIDLVYLEALTAPTYVGQHSLQEHLALFERHGYQLLGFYNQERRDGALLQLELIAVRPVS